jgi:hypothetical protein
MTCRLFIDEVGNDDVKSPAERFLSLTGITTKKTSDERLITPEIERIKRDFFGHNPPERLVVLHRKEILRAEPPFEALRDLATKIEWDRRILHLIASLPYTANTVLIDKKEHSERYKVWLFNPYHYCLTVLIERYVLWLERHDLTGDVVAEARDKRPDKKLARAFRYIYQNGTQYVPASMVQARLTTRELKLEPKTSNVCGLQLVEMIGHPSYQAMKAEVLKEEMTAKFGKSVVDILKQSRYARNPKNGIIRGWGQKWLP